MVLLGIWLLAVMGTFVDAQQKPIACTGVNLIRVNCFKSITPKTSLSNLIFTKKVNYRQWNSHMTSIICECVARRGNSNNIGIRNIGECWTGNLYAKEGSAPIGGCNTWNAASCKPNMDCIGNLNTVFVYRVQPITTPKPGVTTKPTTAKPTTKISPANLMCFNYLIKMKLRKTPPGKPGSPSFNKMKCNICKTIKTIYKCYPCFHSAHFINTTTVNKETTASIVLKFGCKGKHLNQLISKLTKDAIVSAVCQDTSCPITPLLAMSMPGCTMTTACPASAVCSAPVSYPCATHVQTPPVSIPVSTCPSGCPSTCAPTCSVACCRSRVPGKMAANQVNRKSLYDYSLEDSEEF